MKAEKRLSTEKKIQEAYINKEGADHFAEIPTPFPFE